MYCKTQAGPIQMDRYQTHRVTSNLAGAMFSISHYKMGAFLFVLSFIKSSVKLINDVWPTT